MSPANLWKKFAALTVGVAALAPLQFTWAADDVYPSRAIRLVVPFPPGGPTDAFARIVAGPLGKELGQTIVIENKPGANTIIAAQDVWNKLNDGYTLFLAQDSTLTMNPSLYSKLPYDPEGFAPVGRIAYMHAVLAVNPAVPANTVSELIAYAKGRPGGMDFTASSIPMQLAGEHFGRLTDLKLNAIPYKGGGEGLKALLANEVSMGFEGASSVLPHWRSGKLKVLAVTGVARLPQAPELPTLAEAGVKDFGSSVWSAIVAPPGTSKVVVAKVHTALATVLKTPAVVAQLTELGIEPSLGSPEDLHGQIRKDAQQWGRLIRQIGMKVN
ncbi:Tripartite tricarboxylate transporter family receptor [Xylophilus ampelinus]|nr:Tripartite tricarboxylate transporter family receptor [Xylophilus ampelinus]